MIEISICLCIKAVRSRTPGTKKREGEILQDMNSLHLVAEPKPPVISDLHKYM